MYLKIVYRTKLQQVSLRIPTQHIKTSKKEHILFKKKLRKIKMNTGDVVFPQEVFYLL